MKILGLLLLVVLNLSAVAGEQAELWMDEGLKLLKDKPDTALVQAAGLFSKAAEAYEAKGNEAKAAEANSCLYWTRKKFTIRETGIIVNGNPAAAKRMEKLVAEKPKEEDAKGYLERADAFAKESKDPLLTAIRYFEVADRFPTTDEGRRAMDGSLKAMSKVNTVAKKESGPDPKSKTPTDRLFLASLSFQETMGYEVVELKLGTSSHTNESSPWTEIPEELKGKAITQVVASKTSPVRAKFLTSGKLLVLLDTKAGQWYQKNLEKVKKMGVKSTWQLKNSHTVYEVWEISGQEGKIFEWHTQIVLIGNKLTKE